MATSNVEPDWYWLRKIERDTAYLKIRWNIAQKQVEEAEGKRTEYVYDEEEITVTIPEAKETAAELKSYLSHKKASFITKGKEQKAERDKTIVVKPKTIRTMDIIKLREELKGEKEK